MEIPGIVLKRVKYGSTVMQIQRDNQITNTEVTKMMFPSEGILLPDNQIRNAVLPFRVTIISKIFPQFFLAGIMDVC